MWIVFIIFLLVMLIPFFMLGTNIKSIYKKQSKHINEQKELKQMTIKLLRDIDSVYHYEILKYYINL